TLNARVYSLEFFLFTDPAPPPIYPLSLHDALPISGSAAPPTPTAQANPPVPSPQPNAASPAAEAPHQPAQPGAHGHTPPAAAARSEEHTSELQSHLNLVCRLLLEKKKKTNSSNINN